MLLFIFNLIFLFNSVDLLKSNCLFCRVCNSIDSLISVRKFAVESVLSTSSLFLLTVLMVAMRSAAGSAQIDSYFQASPYLLQSLLRRELLFLRYAFFKARVTQIRILPVFTIQQATFLQEHIAGITPQLISFCLFLSSFLLLVYLCILFYFI